MAKETRALFFSYVCCSWSDAWSTYSFQGTTKVFLWKTRNPSCLLIGWSLRWTSWRKVKRREAQTLGAIGLCGWREIRKIRAIHVVLGATKQWVPLHTEQNTGWVSICTKYQSRLVHFLVKQRQTGGWRLTSGLLVQKNLALFHWSCWTRGFCQYEKTGQCWSRHYTFTKVIWTVMVRRTAKIDPLKYLIRSRACISWLAGLEYWNR